MTDSMNRHPLHELRGGSAARCCGPGEEGYDEARRVWNGAIDRQPGADRPLRRRRRRPGGPVRPRARPADRGARRRHSVVGYGVCDDGVMIDLSLLKAVSVDPAARTAGRRAA